MRRTEPGETDVRTGLAEVHDPVQARHGTAAQVSEVRGEGRPRAVLGRRIRREHDATVRRRPLGVRRPRKHHRHGGTYVYNRSTSADTALL